MYEQNLMQLPKNINCLIHKKEKATHICTDLQCYLNPLICSICQNDAKYKNVHSLHENSVRNLVDAIQYITALIKNQTKSIDSVYQRTIGNRDHELIRFHLEKGNFLLEELENRVETLKIQIDLEIQLLIKQFQKQMQFERQELTKKLEEYKKVFISNIEYVRGQCNDILSFQTSLKYYNNPNNLLLKLINETSKRSLEWFIQQKKSLLKVGSIIDNPLYSQNLVQQLTKINKMNMMVLPFWKGEKNQAENQRDLKVWIKNNTRGWIEIPDIIELTDYNANRPQDYYSYKTLQNYHQMPA